MTKPSRVAAKTKGEMFGPHCPAGDACEVLTYLEEYERVDRAYERQLVRDNVALRLGVNKLEAQIAELRDPEEDRGDGERVRKDRWQSGFRTIVGILRGHSSQFEIKEIVEEVRALATEWGDVPLPEDVAIAAAHPMETGRHDLYAEAARLVGARQSKAGLVDLVTWLLHRIENHENSPDGASPQATPNVKENRHGA